MVIAIIAVLIGLLLAAVQNVGEGVRGQPEGMRGSKQPASPGRVEGDVPVSSQPACPLAIFSTHSESFC